MTINYKKLGTRIRYYRTKAGISQEKLSEMISVSFQHISNIENGKKGLSLDAIINIAQALNISIDQLLIDSIQQNKNDLNAILLDCTPEETSILIENLTTLKKTLSKFRIKA